MLEIGCMGVDMQAKGGTTVIDAIGVPVACVRATHDACVLFSGVWCMCNCA